MAKIVSLDQIKKSLNFSDLITDLEHGYKMYSDGNVEVPPVGFLHFDDPPGDVHLKYGYIKNDDIYVVKIASGFYNNHELGISSSDGLILVFSQKTGVLQSILLDECYLTDIRTAVGGAVVAKYLAPSKVSKIGIVGTGVQARLQLQMLQYVVDCNQFVIWGRNQEKIDLLIKDVKSQVGFWPNEFEIEGTTDMNYLTAQCNLIVTTTGATAPLIDADQISPGTHITAMGSDDFGKMELDAKLLQKADLLVADSISQCVHHGEMLQGIKNNYIKEEDILELGNVISNPKLGRTDDKQITIADQTGVAVQDIQIAKMVNKLMPQ
jgi:ornithine cyclodeaminase